MLSPLQQLVVSTEGGRSSYQPCSLAGGHTHGFCPISCHDGVFNSACIGLQAFSHARSVYLYQGLVK